MTFLQRQQMIAREKYDRTFEWDVNDYGHSEHKSLLDTLTKNTIKNTIKHLEDSGVLEERDVSGEFNCDLVYRTPPQDGESVTYTHINYDERKGENKRVRAVKKELEALVN